MDFFTTSYQEPDTELPEILLNRVINGFSRSTDGIAELSVVEMTNNKYRMNSVGGTFSFSLVLNSPMIPSYSYTVLDFGYNMSLYPINIRLNQDIASELKLEEDLFGNHKIGIESEADFLELLRQVFSTSYFNRTVGGLLKISKNR
ncbi:hypothetical protein EAY27_16580 [Vibrio anguillarum]|nr:hypothetical protein [Vibrio anguillarum]MBF4258870.1 hypothetical protein [Vibrio anguillarum]MBF4278775.1 hypothetical protein [Vibrio anguillarum]MBF4300861.1 hypothetical protein [Vibrio anguillarum]MBF4364588.1 hypothetical protein [Vibrio anguillarum]MBF4398975.1 hypothetical protein [Vibrio anguillarum]